MVLTPLERLGLALEGRYRIERMLGQGGMALVFAATDLRQPRSVAIKLLRPELATLIGPDRFLREIAISAQLNHPHILPLFESGEADGLPWFVMPLVEGESLRDLLLRERQLSLEEALRITREVADALDYAHAQGIIHRDIKPENILLSRGHALVADFGIGRALDAAGGDRLTETGLAVGTPTYMSPEQASGTGQIDPRSDLYSLACVLYEMLAGTPPFAAPTAQGVISRHLVDTPPPIRTVRNTVPVHVETAIMAALAKAKADRFASPAEFVRALDGTRPSPSQPYPSVQVARPRIERRKARSLVFAATFLGVAGLGAVAFWPPRVKYLPDRVVVTPLEVPADNPSLQAFGEQLLTKLTDMIGQEGVGEPVPSARVREEVAKRTPASDNLAATLARETSAGLVLRGACFPRASRAECEIELLRMPGSIPRLSFTAAGDPANPAFAAELVERAVVILLLQQRWGDRTNWRGEYIPHSLEAVRELHEGYDLLHTSSPGALGHFQRAYLLDTMWVLAFPDIGDTIKLASLSLRQGLRSSERETIGIWQADKRADWKRAYELASRRFAVQPELWLFEAVNFALLTDRPQAALGFFRYADSVKRTTVGTYRNAAYAMHHLAHYQDEIKLAARIRERFASEDPIHYRTVEIMGRAGAGDVEGVRRVVAEAQATTEANVGTSGAAGSRAWIAGTELMAHGHELEGREMIAASLPIFQRLRQQNGPAGYAVSEVEALLVLHRLDEANTLALESLPQQKILGDSVVLIGLLGQIAAQRGARDQALQYSDLARQVAGTNGWDEVRARIAARLGDPEGAVRFLQSTQAAGDWGQRHYSLHRDPALASLRDYPPFQQLIKPKG